MIYNDETACPKCGGVLKHYDSVQRLIRTKEQKTKNVTIRRLRCTNCGTLHRELPDNVVPYKQYAADIITDVVEGRITTDTLGYENYPCEATMIRWRTEHKRGA